MRTALYRHYDADGRLLYVGIAGSLTRRDKQHRDHSAWFASVARTETEWLSSRDDALAAERRAIATEHPLHNQANAIRPANPNERQGAFGDALIAHMARTGLSVAAICEASGVSRDVLMKLRTRPGSSTTVENAAAIARAFGKSVEAFMSVHTGEQK